MIGDYPTVVIVEDFTLEAGKRIKELRMAKGLTQDKLAEISGVSRRNIASVEADGRELKHTTLARLGQALGVTTDYISYGNVSPSQVQNTMRELGEPGNSKDLESLDVITYLYDYWKGRK